MRSPDAEEWVGAWVNLLQTNRVLEDVLERRLKEAADLSFAEFEVLARLSGAPDGRLKMIDIANLLLASKSGITRIVDRLEGAGLVSRAIPPENRRIVYARITPTGLGALDRANAEFIHAIEETFVRHLTAADVRTLRRSLRKLLVGNGVWEEERCSLKLDQTRRRRRLQSAR
jgi:DNA-binding MarR family transcriptional regulator